MNEKSSQRPMDPTEELVRLIAIQLRLQLGNQKLAILELNKAGFGPSRIADLLHTTPNTVSVTLLQEKKKRTKETRAKKPLARKKASGEGDDADQP